MVISSLGVSTVHGNSTLKMAKAKAYSRPWLGGVLGRSMWKVQAMHIPNCPSVNLWLRPT